MPTIKRIRTSFESPLRRSGVPKYTFVKWGILGFGEYPEKEIPISKSHPGEGKYPQLKKIPHL